MDECGRGYWGQLGTSAPLENLQFQIHVGQTKLDHDPDTAWGLWFGTPVSFLFCPCILFIFCQVSLSLASFGWGSGVREELLGYSKGVQN